MSDNIRTNITGRLTSCLQETIDKTAYLVEAHFSDKSTQSVADKLKRVILHATVPSVINRQAASHHQG
ncbi:MAG: transposon-encoded TnpW family protein [Blautia sp.]|nr:transposon-encoded TnpW family protein [Blautia sp.]